LAFVSQGSFTEITGDRMIMGNHRYGARFGTAVANVGDLNMDGYEGKQCSHSTKIFTRAIREDNCWRGNM
jgi:hypothetical protein